MLNMPIHPKVPDAQPITALIEPCPYCGTHEAPEDRDSVLSCPNCGYPLAQDIPLIDDWAWLLPDGVESLDETGWANLLVEADALAAEGV